MNHQPRATLTKILHIFPDSNKFKTLPRRSPQSKASRLKVRFVCWLALVVLLLLIFSPKLLFCFYWMEPFPLLPFAALGFLCVYARGRERERLSCWCWLVEPNFAPTAENEWVANWKMKDRTNILFYSMKFLWEALHWSVGRNLVR